MSDNDIDVSTYADEDTATYVLLEVDDTCNSKGGYLRLGAVDPAVKAAYNSLADGATITDNALVAKGEDLASMVRTYVDDSRIRGRKDVDGNTTAADNKFHTLTQAQRKAETDTLHTKGGWRDHTEGNRIVTTRGDKIEVIRGNYKMRVLGRKQWKNDAGSGLHWESSGGVTYAYDEVPGQIIDVRWDYKDGTWHVMEECDSGHVVERYHGVLKEWVQGGDVVDRVGSDTVYDDSTDNKAAWYKDEDVGFDSDSDFSRPTNSAHQDGVTWPSSESLINVREEKYCVKDTETLVCRNLVSRQGSLARYIRKIEDKTHAKKELEDNYYTDYFNLSIASFLAAETWEGAFFEDFRGINLSAKLAQFIDLRIGAALELDAVLAKADIKIARNVYDIEVCAAWTDITLGTLGLEFEKGGTAWEVGTTKTEVSLFKWRNLKLTLLG